MDDDKILERGGSERDIEEYAKQNGADSPLPEIIDKGMEERFDKEFGDVYKVRSFGLGDYSEISDEIKAFINSEIQQALQRERELWLEKLEDRQKLFNFIPQDKYGYKIVKTNDLNIKEILSNHK